jgi:Protein of unknown function (DUF3455)
MTQNTVFNRQTVQRIACASAMAAIGLVHLVAFPTTAQAQSTRSAIPTELQVPAGNRLFLKSRASGTQNYICLPTSTGVAWTFTGPQATLFDNYGRQITTHFLSPNPAENNTPRPAWQSSRDSSTVWAMSIASVNNPAVVAPGAIPWLLLRIVGTQTPHSGRGQLSNTSFIQRLNTTGGVAPATGCGAATDIGKRSFVPYTTDYLFYQSSRATNRP